MVTEPRVPSLTWPEVVSAGEAARLAGQIAGLLESRLRPAAHKERRLFGVVPTPSLSAAAEARFLEQVQDASGESSPAVRALPIIPGRCYLFESASSFVAALPVALSTGPPEVTLLAFNAAGLAPEDGELATLVRRLLDAPACTDDALLAVGLHFDSGVLMEVFGLPSQREGG